MTTHRIAELTAPEVARRLSAGACALLPMGSTETHGPQAPMGDFLLAEEIAARIAAESLRAGADALVCPAIPYGGEDFFAGVPGGVSLSSGLLQGIVEETAEAFIRTGTRRFMVVNGHAGSIAAVEAASRALRRRHGIVIPTLHLWRSAGALHAELGGAVASLGHGGDPVWSVALALRPDLCHPDAARARTPEAPFLGLRISSFGNVHCAGVDFAVPIEVEEIAPGGVQCQDSRGGSAQHGERIVERLVTAGAAMVRQLREHAP